LGVYPLGRRTRLLSTVTGRTSPLPTKGSGAGLVLAGNRARVVWVEPLGQGSRVRELVLDR